MQTQHTDAKTGTPDPIYDIVSVMYHALQAAETGDEYVADADQCGDGELTEFFRDVQSRNRDDAERAKALLRQRLAS
jgi:hypothetical protein